ncbi:50S ribosomal protein L21 [Rhodovibrio salinarum]|uniref:Large ribosomal subunit protein bL21 n=1 Tax=Rhodovibrio salinarum TaxID=1087 RepID=A0A934UZ04_9PROT|nr:50S ribosomal protein L21 [Rhodovibrio salinarum]MBK1695984.1 50S ribosomal protein L21 [Rhodovibrio salinarum]
MFAVIQTGGKQYKVAKHDVVKVEKLPAEVGESVTLDDVRMVGGDGAPQVGAPKLDGAKVAAEVVDQDKNRTIHVFKKKRRKNFRRCNGHRQRFTLLRVTDIQVGDKTAGEGDAAKAKQADQKVQARSQKQATQSATTQQSKQKSTATTKQRTQSKIAKAGSGGSKAKSGGQSGKSEE